MTDNVFEQAFDTFFGSNVQPAPPDDPRLGQLPPALPAEVELMREASGQEDFRLMARYAWLWKPMMGAGGLSHAAVMKIIKRQQARERLASTSTYTSSPTRSRRTKADMALLAEAIIEIVAENQPVTVRQVFYRMVSAGLIAKSEGEYNGTVGRLLRDLRLEGAIPFGWIADNTRWMRKPTTYGSVEDALRQTARYYRRAVWRDLDQYVEVWLEKDALAGVLIEETDPYDVPLMVTRGYPSLSYLHEAAEAIEGIDKPTFIYYFGDHDPSGEDIRRNVERRLREFAPDADISFVHVAVTAEQITQWQLPTRPTKRSDTRAANFRGESIEVDAIAPQQLRDMVRGVIGQHVDDERLRVLRVAEQSEREILMRLAEANR
ncbi:MAG: hypothetical protein ABI838_08485 [Chloroflexota bacterium]